MQPFTLSTPRQTRCSARRRRRRGAKYIAGGTDLVDLMKDGVERPPASRRYRRRCRCDRHRDRRRGRPDRGAGAHERRRRHAELRRRLPVVAEALLAGASPQLRNMATIGGNLMQRTRCAYFRDVGFAVQQARPGSGCPAIGGDNRRARGPRRQRALHRDQSVGPRRGAGRARRRGRTASGGAHGATRRIPLAEFHLLPGDTPQRETVCSPAS